MKRVSELKGKAESESPCKKHRLDPVGSVRLFENQILTNPLITDAIFADISTSDLLNFSLVSKAWNLTCRGLLVDRSRTYLKLSDQSTVERLQEFYNLISNALPGHQQPVNGIQVKFENPVREWRFSSEPFLGLISAIMEKQEVKCVSFDMSDLHLTAADFYNLFKTLVVPHLGTLEFLEIRNFDGIGNLKTFADHLKIGSLPNMKELNFDLSQERLKTSTFKKILRACPNLKTFPYVFPCQLPTLRNTNKLQLASKVQLCYMRLTPRDIQLLVEYSGLIKKLKMYMRVKPSKNKLEGESISRLQSIFSSPLQLNLEFLHIEFELLAGILLHYTSFRPLIKLNELYCLGSQEWFPSLYKSGTARFAEFIPNVRTMTIYWTHYKSKWQETKYGNENEDGPLSLYQRNTSAVLDSVRVLKIEGFEQRGPEKYEILMKIMDLDEAFPCVTYLEIGFNLSELEDLLKWICESSWGDLLETLIVRKTECLRLMQYPVDIFEDVPLVVGEDFLEAIESKRKPLPAGINYSDKLTHLRRLEVAFLHPVKGICEQDYKQESTEVRTKFKPRDGQEVNILISGCRAQKRMSRVKCGVSVYETIVAIHPCPQDSEYSPMEEILATESICKHICKILPTPDLLNVSLVNRRWNIAARKELHQSRPCTLTLNPITFPEDFTADKVEWLASPGLELFSGLRIITPNARDIKYSSWTLDPGCLLLEDEDLKRTSFKVLEVSGVLKRNSPIEEDQSDENDDEDSDFERMATMLDNFLKILLGQLRLDHVETLVTSIENFDRLFRGEGGNLLVSNVRSIKFVDPENRPYYPKLTKRLFEELEFLETVDPFIIKRRCSKRLATKRS